VGSAVRPHLRAPKGPEGRQNPVRSAEGGRDLDRKGCQSASAKLWVRTGGRFRREGGPQKEGGCGGDRDENQRPPGMVGERRGQNRLV